MSTALYRRYRPETFAEVIGQDHVTVPLMAALSKDRVNHAYLFSGPHGCGKTTSARILARCLNCVKGPTATPCGECESCTDLARGGPGSLDVVEIDAASHGGVDDARSLRERAAFAPARDRFKVFIIDEAHMVSTQGFNALLKIVEEPPAHVRFVFATTEPEKVIGTIRSRTHHYPFRLVPPERLQSYLAQLCEAEGVVFGPGVLPLVVRAGAGYVRDSLSVLDQLIAGTGDEGLTYHLAVSLLGYTDAALLDDVVDGLAAGDGASVFGVVDRVIESGHDPRRFVEDLLERLRDLLVVAAVPDGGHAVLRALPADQLERMRGQSARLGRSELSRAADIVNAALTEMTGATSPRLQLELLCARLLLPGSEDSERGLRARVDRLEKRVGVAGGDAGTPTQPSLSPPAPSTLSPIPFSPSPPSPSPPSPSAASARPSQGASLAGATIPKGVEPQAIAAPAGSAAEASATEGSRSEGSAAGGSAAGGSAEGLRGEPPAPGSASGSASASARASGGLDTDGVRRMWPDVLGALSQLKRATWSLLSQHANVAEYDGATLTLRFSSPALAGSFTRGAHQEFLRQALIEVIGLDCRIEAVGGDRSSGRPAVVESAVVVAAAVESAVVESAVVESVVVESAVVESAQPPAAIASEPAGWGPPAEPSDPSEPSEQPGPSEQSAPAAAPRRPARRSGASTAAAYDDIPLPDEPPADDEPPLPDHLPPNDVGHAQAPERKADRPPDHPTDRPPQRQADRPAQRQAARPAQRQAARPIERPQPKVARSTVAPQDDEVSADDADLEGANLVGPSVVEQLLGGKVIEEREE